MTSILSLILWCSSNKWSHDRIIMISHRILLHLCLGRYLGCLHIRWFFGLIKTSLGQIYHPYVCIRILIQSDISNRLDKVSPETNSPWNSREHRLTYHCDPTAQFSLHHFRSIDFWDNTKCVNKNIQLWSLLSRLYILGNAVGKTQTSVTAINNWAAERLLLFIKSVWRSGEWVCVTLKATVKSLRPERHQ